MQRQIKFRAWDSKAMHTVTLDDLRANVGFNDAENNAYQFSQDFLNRPVMQYTGLKDKNGVEIYEGDIVTWRVNQVFRTAPVYYDAEQAHFWMSEEISSKFLVINDWMRGEYEVIGNIYENPELLEATL